MRKQMFRWLQESVNTRLSRTSSQALRFQGHDTMRSVPLIVPSMVVMTQEEIQDAQTKKITEQR